MKIIAVLLLLLAGPALAQTSAPDAPPPKPLASPDQRLRYWAGVEDLDGVNYGGKAKVIRMLLERGYLTDPAGDVRAAALKALADRKPPAGQ